MKRGGDDDAVYELTGGTGSRRYMAPEVCLRENYGTKVDVYSWAIAARVGVRPALLRHRLDSSLNSDRRPGRSGISRGNRSLVMI